MKKLLLALLIVGCDNSTEPKDCAGVEDIDGNSVDLNKFKGMPIFMVNTASRCGFTPQYENLQNLFINYKDTDLTILAITSNSFNQEYTSNEDIKKICLVNYDIGFVTSSPINVPPPPSSSSLLA